jgi:hypothetical protein
VLFDLMHGLGESIVINLNGKYYEHIEKNKFPLFLFPSEKIISLTDLFYDDMFG